jgi:hypothetical protein
MNIRIATRKPERLELVLTPYRPVLQVAIGLPTLLIAVYGLWLAGHTKEFALTPEAFEYTDRWYGVVDAEHRVVPREAIERFEVTTRVRYGLVANSYIAVVTSDDALLILPNSLDGDGVRGLVVSLNEALTSRGTLAFADSWATMVALAFVCLLALGIPLAVAWQLGRTTVVVADRAASTLCATERRPFSRPRSLGCIQLRGALSFRRRRLRVDGLSAGPTAESVWVEVRSGRSPYLALARGPLFTGESSARLESILMGWFGGDKRK